MGSMLQVGEGGHPPRNYRPVPNQHLKLFTDHSNIFRCGLYQQVDIREQFYH